MDKEMPIDVLPFRTAFQLSEGGPIKYKGRTVVRAFRTTVTENTKLIISVLKRQGPPPEIALHVYGQNCIPKIGQGTKKAGVIWLSQWDKPIEITFEKVKQNAEFVFWNAVGLRIGGATNDSWGNFGMIVESEIEAEQWIVRCCQSEIDKNPDFDGLQLRVTKREFTPP